MNNTINILYLFLFILSVCIANDIESNYEEFYGWCTEQGILFENIRIQNLEGYGRGIVAISDIKVKFQIVPATYIIRKETSYYLYQPVRY